MKDPNHPATVRTLPFILAGCAILVPKTALANHIDASIARTLESIIVTLGTSTLLAFVIAIANLFQKTRLFRILSFIFAAPLAIVTLFMMVRLPELGVFGIGLLLLLGVIINYSLPRNESTGE